MDKDLVSDQIQEGPLEKRAPFFMLVKLVAVYFLPVLMLFMLGGFGIYHYGTDKYRELLRVNQLAAVDILHETIAQDVQWAVADLQIMAGGFSLSKLFDAAGAVDPAVRHDMTQDFQVFSEVKRWYDQLRILDRTGMELIRVNYTDGKAVVVPDDMLQNKGGRYFFDDTFRLAPGEVFISPLDLNVEQGKIEQPLKPMIRIGTPFVNALGEKAGIVLVNLYGEVLLHEVDRIKARFPDQHLMMLNAQGYWLKAPDAATEWGFMYDDRKALTFGQRYPSEWNMVRSAHEGFFSTPAGMFCFHTVYPLKMGQRSSIGTNKPVGNSETKISGDDYVWKIVSQIPPEMFAVADREYLLRIIAVEALILGLVWLWLVGWVRGKLRKRTYDAQILAQQREIAGANQQLRAVNQQLASNEQQLRASNQALRAREQQLLSGEQELKKKMQELEAINSLMGEREFRVIEMKKEINALLRSQGKPDKYSQGLD